MNASSDIQSGRSKLTPYLHRELRRIFSIQYQLSELKRLAGLFRVPPVGTLSGVGTAYFHWLTIPAPDADSAKQDGWRRK
jgi:hypothetical protein